MKKHELICVFIFFTFLSCQSQSKEKIKKQNITENTTNTKSKVERYLNKLEELGFTGTVLLDVKGEKQISKGYGYSDHEKQIKNTQNTIFDIGSVTKQFTAAGILKLEMIGKLSVNDKLSKYISNVPADKENITLHHLLTHSSGLLPGIGDDYENITVKAFINKAFNQKLLFTPGEKYEYSNVGYSFLGMVIEKVSGMTYESFLYENLWKPSGMETTGYTRPKFNQEKIAIGYFARGDKWGYPNKQKWGVDAPYWNLKANGGILSTTEDMYKWHKALLADKVLSKAAKEKYYTRHIKEGEMSSYYGYGWAIYNTSRDTKLVAHNGGNNIFYADFWRYLDDDMAIIIMTNSSTKYSRQIAAQIGAITILPDFEPNFPSGKNSEMNDMEFDEESVRSLVRLALKTLNEKNEDAWKSFINNHGGKDFIKMAPMATHLEFFNKFHNKLKEGEAKKVELMDDELIIGVQTKNGMFNLIMNIEKNEDGSLKFAGMMVE